MEKIQQLPLGALGANCYILAGDNNRAVVIDPASVAEVLTILDLNEMTLGAIVVTHGHYDHFAGVSELKEKTGADVYAPTLDVEMFASEEKSWARFMPHNEFKPIVPDYVFADGDEFTVSGITFRVMATPGHTAGSCLLICDSLNAIFTGDVIFSGSVGRSDGYSGSERQTMESMKKIKALNGNYTLCCGHGEATLLESEKRYNPYLYNC